MLEWNAEDWHKNILRKACLKNVSDCFLLDVGCGSGEDSKLLSPYVNYVVGVDIHLSYSKLPKVANADFIVADACHLPFIDGSFGYIFEKDALHHIPNHKKGLEEMKRAAEKDGKVVVMEANRYNPVFYLHMTTMEGHQHFTQKYFKNLLCCCFKDVTFSSFESHVYPIKNKFILRLVHFVEDFLGNIPFVKVILSYNIAICGKE
jgi:ubiquinone/menaquinone biosynthesis C-methylase UbiE